MNSQVRFVMHEDDEHAFERELLAEQGLPAGPKRSANPSGPDAQVWVGPHALDWLRQDESHRIKQFLGSIVEARLARS